MPSTLAGEKALRFGVAGCNAMTWISSLIVVGITGYFLNNFPHDHTTIYTEVISALVLGLWLPSSFLPITPKYKYYYAPLNFIFSYLWLTAFIFAAQEYNRQNCHVNAPFGGSCSMKFANQSFVFLAFFFSFVAFLLDVYAWKTAAVVAAEPVHPEKPQGAAVPPPATV